MAKTNEVTRSKNYEKVKGYYDGGYWNDVRVRNAVAKGWITESEFKEITGGDYGA